MRLNFHNSLLVGGIEEFAMKCHKHSRILVFLLSYTILPVTGWSYFVSFPLPLDKMVQEADIVVKATVLSTDKTADDTFKPYTPFVGFSTKMKIVSVLKGQLSEKNIDFRHYDKDNPKSYGFGNYEPQAYHFQEGKTYIVFAKLTKTPGLLRQVWDSPSIKSDQGQVIAADNKPVKPNTPVKQAIWEELVHLLHSSDPTLIKYAIGQLQSMSCTEGSLCNTADYPRQDVISVLTPVLAQKDPQIVSLTINAIGARSPYLSKDKYVGWLLAVGRGGLLQKGYAKSSDNWDNPDACKMQSVLIGLGSNNPDAGIRAQAIRSLGLCKDTNLLKPLRKWSIDSSGEVRAAAAVLWTDFPGLEAEKELLHMSDDAVPSVRLSVAAAVGFMQSSKLLTLLEKLLQDKDPNVRTMAATSAISFNPKESETLLKKLMHDPEFHANFVNALALNNPKPYLDELRQILLNKEEPKLHFVSQVPMYTSWLILKSEMDSRTSQELATGRLDKYLEALDSPPNIGSGPYQEMYRFYLEKGLNDRAIKFRESTKKREKGYDIDYYFKRVDSEVETERAHEASELKAEEKHRQEAKVFLDRDDWYRATQMYQEILKKNPEDKEAKAGLSKLADLEAQFPTCRLKFAKKLGDYKPDLTIRGTICVRRLLSRSTPDVPQELKTNGIIQARTTIGFEVSDDGSIIEKSVHIRHSSSYSWLDNLAIENLKKWKYEPKATAGKNDSGIISFDFHQ